MTSLLTLFPLSSLINTISSVFLRGAAISAAIWKIHWSHEKHNNIENRDLFHSASSLLSLLRLLNFFKLSCITLKKTGHTYFNRNMFSHFWTWWTKGLIWKVAAQTPIERLLQYLLLVKFSFLLDIYRDRGTYFVRNRFMLIL